MNFIRIFLISFILLIILTISKNIVAQYYVVGQDPASITWNQINSPDFRIIFPSGYEKKAQEYIKLT